MRFLYSRPWFAVYEGEGDQGGSGEGDQGGTSPPPPPSVPSPVIKTFSQDQVNKMLAEDRRKHKEQVQQTVTTLEEFKKNHQLTEQQKADLEQKLEVLNNSLLTEQEKAKQELQKKEKEFKSSQETTAKERDQWKGRYETETTRNQILQAARTHKVLKDEQLMELLMPKARLVEVLGPDGKTSIGYAPKVKFRDKNEKGEDVELDLSIEDTVKRMRELPDRFGNLFESGMNGGLGASGSAGQGGQADMNAILNDPERYRQHRQKMGLGKPGRKQ